MYWNFVLNEVLHKNDKDYSFHFTNIGDIVQEKQAEESTSLIALGSESLNYKKPVRYYVSENHSQSQSQSQFFTQREYDCMQHLLKGKTLKQTAFLLGLSPRTVEYYLNNIKRRFGCHNKITLLKKARCMKLFEK